MQNSICYLLMDFITLFNHQKKNLNTSFTMYYRFLAFTGLLSLHPDMIRQHPA